MEIPLPEALGIVNLVAGFAMLALGVTSFGLAPSSRLFQLLALYLVLRGAMNLTEAYTPSLGLRDGGLLGQVHLYYDIAVAASSIAFAVAFRRRYGPTRTRRASEGAWLGLILLVALALVGAYVMDASLYYGDASETGPGPLVLVSPLRLTCYSVIALLVALDSKRATEELRALSMELVAIGFALTPLFFAPPPVVLAAFIATPQQWLTLASATLALGGAATAAAAIVTLGTRRAWLAGAVAVLAAGGVLVASVSNLALASPAYRIMDGALSLTLPLLVAYALFRHRLFDLDVRIRWTISRGTLAAIFVAVFFVASELASQLFQTYTGSAVFGILAAGLLVFALTPLQNFAERIAHRAIPDAKPAHEMPESARRDFYREQVRIAWSDGILTLDERRMLDAARQRLALTPEQAAALEAEVTRNG